jgi:hypothetical protein
MSNGIKSQEKNEILSARQFRMLQLKKIWFDCLAGKLYGRSAHVYKTHLFWVLFLSCHLFQPKVWRRVGGAWVAGWVLCVTAQPHNGSTKEWAGGGGWEGKREPIVVLCRATNFLAAAVLPCWPIVNARLANRLGRLLRACSSFFLLFYTPFIPPPPLTLSLLYSAIISAFQCARHDYYVVNWCVFVVKLIRRNQLSKRGGADDFDRPCWFRLRFRAAAAEEQGRRSAPFLVRHKSLAARQQLTTNFPERIMQTAQIYGEGIRNKCCVIDWIKRRGERIRSPFISIWIQPSKRSRETLCWFAE